MVTLKISPDAYVYATLVDGYIRNGDFEDAKKLFDDVIKRGIDPGRVGYNAMIKGYCKFGMMRDAVSCVRKMVKRNHSPDEFTYSTVIDGYVKQNDLYSALAIFCHALKQNCAPNVVTCTSLIGGFCRRGDFDGADGFFKGMQSGGIVPNVVTYTVLIGSFCKEGKLVKVSLIFEEMLENKCSPNDVTFHYLVNGLSNNLQVAVAESDLGKPTMLLDIFGRMISDGWQSISAAHVSIIACLCLKGMLGNGLGLTEKMLGKGFGLDSVTLSALLHGACLVGKSKEWRDVIMTSKLVEPNLDIGLTYLSVFGRYTNREVSIEVSRILHALVEELKSSEKS